MQTRPLTRSEAIARAEIVEVESYAIEIDLRGCDVGRGTFGSQTLIKFFCSQPGASTFAEFRSNEPARAELNGREVAVVDGRIPLDGLQERNELRVSGQGMFSTAGEGLHRAVDPADGAVYVYSMCFLHDASRVFACFDQPDLKATFQLVVRAPNGWKVVSNSPTVDGAAWTFEQTPKLPTYLVALAAGPYASAHSTWSPPNGGSEVPLGLYCRKSMEPYLEADDVFATTRAGLEFYTNQFGVAFPFVKYDQLFAPEFNAGAMENAGLVIHMDEMLFRCAVTDSEREARAMIVLHEMAHMWFGDLVTMRWWDDLWLNEAFATYCSYLATAEVTSFTSAWTTFCINEKTRGRAGDARPSRHPVSGVVADTDAALMNFDAISYNKAASLLRQLTAYLGRDTFFIGITDYFERHAWGNTNLGDLMQALELASGRALGEWSDRHLTSVGCPTLAVVADVEPASGNLTALELVQTEVITDQRVGVGVYQLKGGLLVRVGAAEVELVGERTPVPSLVGLTKPDVLLANDSDFAYASIRCDPSSLELLNSLGVSAFADSLPRALTWGALWDLTITAQLPPATFVELVNKSVSGESHDAVLEQLLAWAAFVCDKLVPCSESERLRANVSDALTKAAEIAEPLSGRRLALARGEAAFATTPQQLERVESWLANPVQQHGLTIDADLRWHVIQRLVSTGRRTARDIETEFERDSTAFGRFRADRALAAIPELGAKERAWRAATGLVGAATNRTVLEACLGFWQWNQRELCRPFVPRYFAELDRVWSDCDTEIAHQMTTELFPATFVERETLKLVDQHLVRADLPSGQRRILADARFDLVLALQALGVGDPVHGITRSEDIDAS